MRIQELCRTEIESTDLYSISLEETIKFSTDYAVRTGAIKLYTRKLYQCLVNLYIPSTVNIVSIDSLLAAKPVRIEFKTRHGGDRVAYYALTDINSILESFKLDYA